jgi:hypothetical protein
MENYWEGFCRKNNMYFEVVPMSLILQSFYYYTNGDICQSDYILKESYNSELDKPLDVNEKGLLPCPNCGCLDLAHHYVYIKCNKCLMCGPKGNGGHNDAHADNIDYKNAIKDWNNLPRKRK